MPRYSALLALLLLFGGVVCGQAGDSSIAGSDNCRAKATKLLDEALSFMQNNYYRRYEVQWDSLRAAALTKIKTAASCNETFDIISWCFKELGATHSFVLDPLKAAVYNQPRSGSKDGPSPRVIGEISSEMLDNNIGYIKVPWVSTTDSFICMHVADSLQHLIASLEQQGAKKWIVDLRENTGGNCWPMLAGLGPLIGTGVCGYFVTAAEKIPIRYENGGSWQGRNIRCRIGAGNGHILKNDNPPVIVLTGKRTVSSGEIIALAFKGRQHTYFYGEATGGLTTANATYSLSDHSMLVLTVCQEADRYGRLCEGKIIPDEIIASEAGRGSGDAAKGAAMMWLSSQ